MLIPIQHIHLQPFVLDCLTHTTWLFGGEGRATCWALWACWYAISDLDSALRTAWVQDSEQTMARCTHTHICRHMYVCMCLQLNMHTDTHLWHYRESCNSHLQPGRMAGSKRCVSALHSNHHRQLWEQNVHDTCHISEHVRICIPCAYSNVYIWLSLTILYNIILLGIRVAHKTCIVCYAC